MAIKTGVSIAATGTITGQTDSTLSFSQTINFIRVINNTGAPVYVKFNGAMTGGPPTGYDYLLANTEEFELFDETLDISNIHVYKDSVGNITLPANTFVAIGW
jgi:hypothetical protein